MKKIRLSFFLLLIVVTHLIFAQEKYAVIINAYAPDTKDSENSWALANPTTELYFEFWNDVYLMWEKLYERGFNDENIFEDINDGKESHKFTLNMRGLPPGIYFCSIYVNGRKADTKKIVKH